MASLGSLGRLCIPVPVMFDCRTPDLATMLKGKLHEEGGLQENVVDLDEDDDPETYIPPSQNEGEPIEVPLPQDTIDDNDGCES